MARHLKFPRLGALEPGDAPRRPARKRSGPRANPGALAEATARAEEMVARFMHGGQVGPVDVRLLVGLYAHLHEEVYGVAPDDLARDWAPAVAAARRMVEGQFEGQAYRMVGFLRWTWSREKNRERRRVENGSDASRIGWRLQFQSLSLLTDYRVAVARRYGRRA